MIDDLCERLDVSNGAIREALSRLTAESLVTSEPQLGFRAAKISAEQLRDLTRARFEIERICLRLSIEAGDLEWEAALVSAAHRLMSLDEMEADGTVSEAWSEAHAAFHRALTAACPITTLLRYSQQLWELSERYRRVAVPLSEGGRDLRQEQRELLEAGLARDADRVIALGAEHLETTMRTLLASLEQPRPAVRTRRSGEGNGAVAMAKVASAASRAGDRRAAA